MPVPGHFLVHTKRRRNHLLQRVAMIGRRTRCGGIPVGQSPADRGCITDRHPARREHRLQLFADPAMRITGHRTAQAQGFRDGPPEGLGTPRQANHRAGDGQNIAQVLAVAGQGDRLLNTSRRDTSPAFIRETGFPTRRDIAHDQTVSRDSALLQTLHHIDEIEHPLADASHVRAA